MKKSLYLIEKIEGEAELECSYDGEVVEDARIRFMSSRYIEKILLGRPPLDALAITPRVCGICGHAHLIATAKAIESAMGFTDLSPKARAVRDITLSLEVVQNHFKWFYLTILPLAAERESIETAAKASRIAAEAIAIFAGQYPHNSYALPGGIVSDITPLELLSAQERVEALARLYNKEILGLDSGKIPDDPDIEWIISQNGELPGLLRLLLKRGWGGMGKSHGKYIVLADDPFVSGIFTKDKVSAVSFAKIKESPIEGSRAKRVLYAGEYCETGPLARAVAAKNRAVESAIELYGETIFARILARMIEIGELLAHIERSIQKIDPSQRGYKDPGPLPKECSGRGVVEAARGGLIHSIEIADGTITGYKIVTPSQWNLGCGPKEDPGIAQKALIGLKKNDPIELVLKSFDLCSVCTTH